MGWVWGLLLVLALAGPPTAQSETTKTQSRQIDTMLKQLYPNQDIAAKMSPRALGQAPAQSAPSRASAPTTATLVVRRPKPRRAPADRPTSSTLNPLNPSVTLDEQSSGTLTANPASQAGTRLPSGRAPKKPHLAKLPHAPLRPETPPTMTVTQTTVPPVAANETKPANAASTTSATSAAKPAPATALVGVRVNRAGAGELREKLKLDARRARNIVEFRELYGPFQRPEDLSQVSGITDDMVRGWEEQKLLIF